MTPNEEIKIRTDYSWATSRIATRIIPIIRDSFAGIEIIDLLMSLPIIFKFKEMDYTELPDDVNPLHTVVGGYITRDTERGNPDRMCIFLTFTKDKEKNWDDFFNTFLTNSSQSKWLMTSVAMVYLHEALHLLSRHYDYYLNLQYAKIVKDAQPKMDENSVNQLLNIAFDYWINGFLITQSKNTGVFQKWKQDPKDFPGLYDPDLIPQKMTQEEIVKKLAEEAKIEKRDLLDAQGNKWGEITEVDINGNKTVSINIDGQHHPDQLGGENGKNEKEGKTGISSGAENEQEQSIQEALEGARREILERTRGTQAQKTLEDLGIDYSVPIDWFKYLKASLFNLTQKYTNNYDQTWSKLKNKFRHVAPMPGRIHYEKEIAAIVSIDQSGSMSNEDLEKINYVVNELSKKCSWVEVLLHDTRIAKKKQFKGKQRLALKEFITKRVACGGTSHKEVFQHIETTRRQSPKLKLIYLSFSDNWSDIDQVYDDNVFKGVSSYWITTDESNLVNVPGMQISLEHGLLQA